MKVTRMKCSMTLVQERCVRVLVICMYFDSLFPWQEGEGEEGGDEEEEEEDYGDDEMFVEDLDLQQRYVWYTNMPTLSDHLSLSAVVIRRTLEVTQESQTSTRLFWRRFDPTRDRTTCRGPRQVQSEQLTVS